MRNRDAKEEAPRLALSLTATLTFDPGRDKNRLHFKFQDCCADVSVEERPVGSISGCLGAGIEICDKRTGKIWYITPQEIWAAYEQAVGGVHGG